jgi:hypothetical protein
MTTCIDMMISKDLCYGRKFMTSQTQQPRSLTTSAPSHVLPPHRIASARFSAGRHIRAFALPFASACLCGAAIHVPCACVAFPRTVGKTTCTRAAITRARQRCFNPAGAPIDGRRVSAQRRAGDERSRGAERRGEARTIHIMITNFSVVSYGHER